MATKKDNKKMDKKDHAGMNNAAKIVKCGAVVLGLVGSLISGLKGLSNLVKKS